MGENPSPLGEDFSFVIFDQCKSMEDRVGDFKIDGE